MRLKAEWETQRAILLAFPHKKSDWVAYICEAQECFIKIIKTIILFENVIICLDINDKEGFGILIQTFGNPNAYNFPKSYPTTLQLTPRITLAFMPTNDTWARDFGAITLESRSPNLTQTSSLTLKSSTSSSLCLLDFCFNGWGEKFSANFDNQITTQLYKLGILSQKPLALDFVLEGGSIDTNGEGVLLTTTQCLLEPHRNPYFSKHQIEQFLCSQLHIHKVLWLDSGFLQGDDTDSHIDTLARFIAKDTIAYITCDDKNDAHYAELKQMEEELQHFTDANGKPFKLVRLPFTRPIFYDKERLPASYANFLFINNALLVPTYGDKNDTLALEILSDACPNHKVIGIDCSVLIRQHGSLHCVTMQLY